MGSPPPVSDPSLETVAPNAPVTADRKLNVQLEDHLPKPYLARASVAIDSEHPKGTEGKDPKNMSVLQQHVAFFDRNGDGIVYPWDTYQGSRAIGCGILLSLALALIINLAFSYISQRGWIPNPLLPIYVRNIHRCKHGSDSETYDTEGRFDPSKFDAILSKYALTHPNALTSEELWTMVRANRNFLDLAGSIASFGEWRLLYTLAKDDQGLLHKEAIRGVFDGSLFEQLEKNNASRAKRA